MTAPRRARTRAGVIALWAVLLGLASPLLGATPAMAELGYAPAECSVDVPEQHAHRVTCGILTVPEGRGGAGDPARELQLPVVRVKSTSDAPAADPLIFPTTGGPGGGSVSALWYFLDHAQWATDDRDVIIVEQRGDVDAEPTLDCPELDTSALAEDGRLPTGAALAERRAALLSECRERLVADGMDLAAYTSAASVADLADLRAALGYDQWNLYGVSYGSRLAMTVMRDRPDGLRAVVLDGVYPPNIDRFELTPQALRASIDWLLAACAADADCHERYPDLEGSLERVLERTAREPITVAVRDPATGGTLQLEIAADDIMGGLFDAFYDAATVRVLPFVIDRLDRGDDGVVVPLAQRAIDNADSLSEGLNLSIECAEEVPFNDPALIEETTSADPLLTHYAGFAPVSEDCAVWNVPALPASENDPVSSAIPTLITSGRFDPVTPSAWSEPAAAGLTAAYRYEFPGMGHGAVWGNWYEPCAASVATAFLRDPSVEPDTSCIGDADPIDFLTATDIRPTTAVYRLDADLVRSPNPWQIGIAGVTVIGLGLILLYTLGYGVHRLVRRHGEAPDGAVLTAGIAAGANLAFVGALALILLRTEPLVLGFGLPTGTWPIVLLPLVGMVFTVMLGVLLVRAGVTREGAVGHVVALWIAAAVLVVFAVWVLVRGLVVF